MAKDDNFWLNAVFILFTLVIAYVGYQAINTAGIQFGWLERYDWFPLVNNFGSIILGVAATMYLRSDADRVEYYLTSIGELRKVTWPTYDDTKRMTVVVVVVVAIFAAILGVFDFVWSKALQTILT